MRWAYYPWRRTVVAVLGPRSFRAAAAGPQPQHDHAVRAAAAGRAADRGGRPSVGHAIAHTLAAEGCAGSCAWPTSTTWNCPTSTGCRPRCSTSGVNKAVVAARRIAELDPYLPVEVDEPPADARRRSRSSSTGSTSSWRSATRSTSRSRCARPHARARIPVLMATSDRGLIDVERYDLEPQRPILHGLLGDVDIAELCGAEQQRQGPARAAHRRRRAAVGPRTRPRWSRWAEPCRRGRSSPVTSPSARPPCRGGAPDRPRRAAAVGAGAHRRRRRHSTRLDRTRAAEHTVRAAPARRSP